MNFFIPNFSKLGHLKHKTPLKSDVVLKVLRENELVYFSKTLPTRNRWLK